MIRSTPPKPSRGARRGTAWIVGALALAGLLAGCQALSAVQYLAFAQADATARAEFSDFGFASDIPFPSDLGDACASSDAAYTEYTKGTATVTLLNGATEHLTLQLESGSWAPAGTSPECGGTEALFTGSNWTLVLRPGGFEPLFQIADAQLLLAHGDDSSPAIAAGRQCSLTLTQNDPAGFVGRAKCTGLSWGDERLILGTASPSPSTTGATFDLNVTFEARP